MRKGFRYDHLSLADRWLPSKGHSFRACPDHLGHSLLPRPLPREGWANSSLRQEGQVQAPHCDTLWGKGNDRILTIPSTSDSVTVFQALCFSFCLYSVISPNNPQRCYQISTGRNCRREKRSLGSGYTASEWEDWDMNPAPPL